MAEEKQPLKAGAHPAPPSNPSQPPSERRGGRRRVLRQLLWVVAVLLLLPPALIGLLLAALQTQAGRDLLRDVVVAQLDGPDLAVGIGRIDGAPPGRLLVEDLSVADGGGVWLQADRLLLDWSPLALLGGTLSVERLEAGRLELARLPQGEDEPAPPESEGFSLPRLPVEVQLERLQVDRLALGAPVLGEPLDLTIQASLAAQRAGLVESHLEIAQIGGEGSVSAEASYRLADRHLEASLDASAPAGGLASRLSGLPGAPPLGLSLRGEGPLPGWQATWQAKAGPVATVEGTLKLDSLEPLSLALAADAVPGQDFPAELAPWLQPTLSLALTADYDAEAETARLAIERLASRALSVSGEAQAALAEETADASLRVALGDPAPLQALVPGLNLAGADFLLTAEQRGGRGRLRLDGTLEQPQFAEESSGLGFESLELALDSGERPLDEPLAGDQLAQLTATARGPQGDEALQTLLDETTQLALTLLPAGEELDVSQLRLTSGPLRLDGRGRYRLEGADAGSGTVTATLEHGELARLSDLAGTPLSGSLRAELEGSLRADGSAEATLSAAPENLAIAIPAAQALLGPSPDLRVAAERSADGTLHVTSAELTGAPSPDPGAGAAEALRLTAEGSLRESDGQLQAHASLALPRLAALQGAGLPLGGAATLDLSAFGTLDAPQAAWALRGESLSYQDIALAALSLDGTTDGLPDRPAGRVELEARTAAGTLAGGFGYALEGETARIDDLNLARGADRLTGNLAASLDQGTAEGSLSLALNELAAYGALLGEDMGGSAKADVTLSAREGRQAAEIDASATALRFAGLQLGELRFNATGSDLTGRPSLQAELEAQAFETGDLAVQRLSSSVSGSLEALAVQASLDGRALGHPLTASLAADLTLADDTTIRLSSLEAALGEEQLVLQSPAEILLAGGRTRVRNLELAVAEGRVGLDADLRPDRLALELEARGLPVRLVRLAAPDLEPQGTLDLTASLSGSAPRPIGTLSLSANDLRLSKLAGEDVPPLALTLDGRLSGGRLSAAGRVTGFADRPLVLNADLPLLVSAPATPSLPESEQLHVDAEWHGQLDRLMAILPVDAVRFGGQGAIDLAVSGTLANPQASGSVTVEQGFYENYLLGMRLEPVSLSLTGRGQRLELERFEGRDNAGGSLNAQGFVDLSGQAPSFDLSLKADNAHLLQRDDVRGALDAELALKGSTDQASLEGWVRSRPTEIRLIAALPPSVTELEVVEVGADGQPTEAEEEEEDGGQPGVEGLGWLGLGIDIRLPGQVFVRGRGLDSEWRGDLRITGTAEQPRIQGHLGPVRGSFDFVGRIFNLDPNSTIQFLGGAEVDPELDLTATYSGDELTANILIFGPVSKPEFQLTSTPELPQDEILAQVLFGKSSGQLSTGEAVQLAQAAATLQGGGEGLFDVARRTLGVDVLTFVPGATADDVGSLRVGKYVAEDVFIGAQQGTSAGSSTAIIEWRVTPRISVESEIGADSRSNLGVLWKWDY